MDDHAAVRLCQGGESDAIRLIVERHSGVLYGTAYLMTRNRARAEEMVQEALLLAWRGIRSFNPARPGSNLRSWLIRILVKRVISEGRRSRVEETELGPETPPQSPEPFGDAEGEAHVMRAEERELMGAAMSTLPDEQCRALTLRYYADLTIPEIARVLGWAEGTVKFRIHRVLKRLEDALKPLPPGDVPEISSVVVNSEIDRATSEASPRFLFSAAVTEFAEILRDSPWLHDGSLGAVLEEAQEAVSLMDETPRDREFIDLVERAIRLSDG